MTRLMNDQRRCQECQCILSRYTRDDLCAPCDRRARDRAHEIEERQARATPRRRPNLSTLIKPKVLRGTSGALRPGEWSRKYDICILCGTTEYRHASRGRCFGCITNIRRHRPIRPYGQGPVQDAVTLRRLRVTLAATLQEQARLAHAAETLRAAIRSAEQHQPLEAVS